MDNDFDSKYHCVTIEYNVLHQFDLSCIDILCSLHKKRLIENCLCNCNFNPVFSTTSATSYSPFIAL